MLQANLEGFGTWSLEFHSLQQAIHSLQLHPPPSACRSLLQSLPVRSFLQSSSAAVHLVPSVSPMPPVLCPSSGLLHVWRTGLLNVWKNCTTGGGRGIYWSATILRVLLPRFVAQGGSVSPKTDFEFAMWKSFTYIVESTWTASILCCSS